MSKVEAKKWKRIWKFLGSFQWTVKYREPRSRSRGLSYSLNGGPKEIPGTKSVDVDLCLGIPFSDASHFGAAQCIAMLYVLGKLLGLPIKYSFGYPTSNNQRTIQPKVLAKKLGMTEEQFEMLGRVGFATLTTMFLPTQPLANAKPIQTIEEALLQFDLAPWVTAP